MLRVNVSAGDNAAFARTVDALIADRVASRIRSHDATLWGPDAEPEAAKRLGWTDLVDESCAFVGDVYALREQLRDRGIDHVVLCGMGGSSLAPEVICRAAGVELTVLDTSQPDMVRTALADRLDRTVVVVSSKSGSTVETDSLRRVYESAFQTAGIDPGERIVVVTDTGSPLEAEARSSGYRVFLADPEVGGRYSALTAFGLVPSGLAGADLTRLLDEASLDSDLWLDDPENPAVALGAALGSACAAGVDKLVLVDRTGAGLGDWIEQLIAESTGKQGRGLLPVVVDSIDAPNASPATDDSLVVVIGGDRPPVTPSGFGVAIEGGLGAQFLLWQIATAIAGRVIGINPFDQPDVESAKAASRELLDGDDEPAPPDSVDGTIELYGSSSGSITTAFDELLARIDPQHGYLAVHAYLDRYSTTDLSSLRDRLADRTGRPVTFGWGPRFLHSTGQYHKGGTPNGVFLQISCDPHHDVPIPGRSFSFGQFCESQVAGDAHVLRHKGRPVLRLHLTAPDDLDRIRESLT